MGVPIGAAAHAAIPARVRVVVDAAEAARVRALVTVKADVKIVVVAAVVAAVLRKLFGMYLIFWSKHEAIEQASNSAYCLEQSHRRH